MFSPPYDYGLLLRVVYHNGLFCENNFAVSIKDATNTDKGTPEQEYYRNGAQEIVQ